MSILISKNTRVVTQGITGKTGQFHTKMGKEYANGANCFVAGVNPKKAGEAYEGIPIYASVKEAAQAQGATVSVIYVPPAGAAAAIWEAVARKLRTRTMPPQGMPRPDEATMSSVSSWLTAELDKAAAVPNPWASAAPSPIRERRPQSR